MKLCPISPYDALRLAVRLHGKELDKCGELAVLHPIAVTEVLEHHPVPGEGFGISERSKTIRSAALLHDVFEDTSSSLVTFWEAAGIGQEEWNKSALYVTLDALTRRPGEPYLNYIARCGDDVLASFVKLADLWHNLSPSRTECLSEKERTSLRKRHLRAKELLFAQTPWWPPDNSLR